MEKRLRFDIITGFPALAESPLRTSIVRRARKKKLVQIRVHDLRKYTHDRHRTIDDTPYGGGAGIFYIVWTTGIVDHLTFDNNYFAYAGSNPDATGQPEDWIGGCATVWTTTS